MPQVIPMSQHTAVMQDKRRYSALAAPHLDTNFFQASSRHQSIAAATNPYWNPLSIRAAPYSLPDHLAHSSQFSPLFGSFPTHGSEWPMDPVLPTTYSIPVSVDAAQTMGYATHADYPESSQRTELSSSPVITPADYSCQNDAPKSPPKSPDFSDDGHRLYTMNDIGTPASCRSSSLPPIKMEQQDVDGCFVMELSAAQVKAISLSQSMAPPTEVPLRATHATEEMRKMMGRFRIDPFAIHSGENRGIVAPWCGEACPLEEEPLIFEFQLDIGNVQSDNQEESSVQADLETQTDDSDPAGTQWDEYCRHELIYPTNCTSEWDEEQPSSESVSEFYRRPVHDMHQSFLHKCTQGNTSTVHLASNPTQDLDHNEDRSEFWPRSGSFDAPLRRSTAYTDDSPACSNAVLPSISATVTRRWPIPDPPVSNEAQFLLQ